MAQKTLVIYNSKTGFTERYAHWLAQEVPCELVPYAKRDGVRFADYAAVVYGGWFHAGSIKGLKWFQAKLPELTGKTVAVFATGAAPTDTPQAEEALANNRLTLEGKPVPLFYLPGGLDYSKMSAGNKLLMSFFCKIVKKEQGENSEMYRVISHSYDATSRDALVPLVQCLKERQ